MYQAMNPAMYNSTIWLARPILPPASTSSSSCTLLARLWSDHGQYVIITHRLPAGCQSPRTHLPSLTVRWEVTLQWARRCWPDNSGSSSSSWLPAVSLGCFSLGRLGSAGWRQQLMTVSAVTASQLRSVTSVLVLQLDWFSSSEEGGSLLSAGQPTASQTAAHDRFIACQLIRRPLDRQLLASRWWHTEVKLHWTGSKGTFQAVARESGEDGG